MIPDYKRKADSLVDAPTLKPAILKNVKKILRTPFPRLNPVGYQEGAPSLSDKKTNLRDVGIRVQKSIVESVPTKAGADVTFTSQATFVFCLCM